MDVGYVILTFLEKLGVEDRHFDENGMIYTTVNDGVLVGISYNRVSKKLVIFGKVKEELPAIFNNRLAKNLLARTLAPMYSDAPSLGWDNDLGLVGYYIVPQEDLDVARFDQIFSSFVNWIEKELPELANLDQADPAEKNYMLSDYVMHV
ncbi:CesT family type III secretion system chaperone [Pseudovibrio ascidiaceicola]|uniref:CesT family type III secretion system chaperone n=1 Tax=Pseudovibrio ascidiaceicola TaxID=285279 RepID=UPI000D68D874|nr:CesT family type III secretion system chaperone [Pseudovibrio ascidiaceicola]